MHVCHALFMDCMLKECMVRHHWHLQWAQASFFKSSPLYCASDAVSSMLCSSLGLHDISEAKLPAVACAVHLALCVL